MDELVVLLVERYRAVKKRVFDPWWNKFLSWLLPNGILQDAALRRACRKQARDSGEEGLWSKLRIPLLSAIAGAIVGSVVTVLLTQYLNPCK